jgi:predicted Zn-dependent protease
LYQLRLTLSCSEANRLSPVLQVQLEESKLWFMDRISMLKEVLAVDTNNLLARYGLAMEYSKAGDTEAALAEFNNLISANPDYVAAYQQAAQTLLNAERYEDAKQMLNRGIESAERSGNTHARSEMAGMLMEIG